MGLLNDYVRIPYANGSSFASQFLYRELRKRGRDVTVVGPHDPEATPGDLPRQHVLLPSLPLRMHPGVHIPFPAPKALDQVVQHNFDVVLGQTSTALLDLGAWLRAKHGVPFLCVNTLHLPSVYNVALSDRMLENKYVHSFFEDGLIPFLERNTADNFNGSDGLIVLSKGMKTYWRERGVKVPIHVINRSVEPKVFDVVSGDDPFDSRAKRGGRILCVCRHTREKRVSELLDIFARFVAPKLPDATLTLVGDGPDHDAFKQQAQDMGVGDRVFFPGEFPLTKIPDFYANADLFAYTSLSETYGQVVSEALWSGLPVVAADDGMGVEDQVDDGETGVLVAPDDHERFGHELVDLLTDSARRDRLAREARRSARERCAPERCVDRYFDAFHSAREHIADNPHDPSRAGHFVRRWSGIHVLFAAAGCLRKPAVINRHGRSQPTWDELEQPSTPPAKVNRPEASVLGSAPR